MDQLFLVVLLLTSLIVLFGKQSTATGAFVFGCIYSPAGVGFDFLNLNFPYFRFLVILAMLRILLRGEHRSVKFSRLDLIVSLLSIFLLLTSLFHAFEPGSGPIYIAGILLNSSGAYFVFRVFASPPDALPKLARLIPLFLLPVAVLMILEQTHFKNYFSLISSLPEEVLIREGRVRSQGPFSHPILAGTIGATFLPFVFLLLREKIRAAFLLISCLAIVFTSASSGPIVALITVIAFLVLWNYRRYFRYLHIIPIVAYILLLGVMNRPPYYLIGEIDLAGGSTGWYRAYLIESTIRHFDEWWLTGTDQTLHWIPFQMGISEKHADITNNFIGYAVMGGLSVLILFVLVNWEIYRMASLAIFRSTQASGNNETTLFLLWASFFGFLATFFSVAYFGQAQVFYWMVAAMIANACDSEAKTSQFPATSLDAAQTQAG